jgi:hypothetical protein
MVICDCRSEDKIVVRSRVAKILVGIYTIRQSGNVHTFRKKSFPDE